LNGTYEITPEGGKLREFHPDDFLTYQLPFAYKPKATCALFNKFLNRVLPDKDCQKVLAEFQGYIFARHLKLEKTLLLYGSGANGKSVLFDVVNALLGPENISNFSLAGLKEDNNRAHLANKLLNYSSELHGKLESDIFKQMVSGEPISARLLYCNSFIMENYARLCFNANELPKDIEHSEAYFRRFLIIPFEVTIPEEERDPELAKKIIENELSGVFNWVLEGLKRLFAQKKFSECKAAMNVLQEYKEQSDSVHLFLDEKGYQKSTTSYQYLKDILQEYRSFCMECGFYPLNQSNFKRRIKANGYVMERKNKGHVIYLIIHQEF